MRAIGSAGKVLPFLVKNIRILIADDHDVVRAGVRRLLEKEPGWEVCGEAADGREAVTDFQHRITADLCTGRRLNRQLH
jgi:CheY-like chemotaxis protein